MRAFTDERVREMLRGRRTPRLIPFPGVDPGEDDETTSMVGVRVLTEDQIDQCRFDATQHFGKTAKLRGLDPEHAARMDAQNLDREVRRSIIYRAFVDSETMEAKDPKPYFESIQAVRDLDTVMVELLFEVYLDQQNYVNPLRAMSDEEARELADALSKEPKLTAYLALFDAPSLRRLVRSLVALVARLLTSRSPTSSSSNEDGTDS